MDRVETSLENLIGGMSENNYLKNYEWSIRDINNVETADRKLIINKKLSFWVHDDALTENSNFFAELFEEKTVAFNSNESNIEHQNKNDNYLQIKTNYSDKKKTQQEQFIDYSSSDDEVKESEISIPHETLFFDILLWIYTKDHRKLKKVAKTFSLFINLITLGLKLKMKPEYFDVLLNKIEFEWKLEYFNTPYWSKATFTFPILERIVDDMKASKTTKIIALFSWLKIEETQVSESNQPSNSNIKNTDYMSPKSIPNQTPETIKSTNPNSSVNNINQSIQSDRETSNEVTTSKTVPYTDASNKQEKVEAKLLFSPNKNLNQITNESELKKTKEILESKDLFFVRNYIIGTKLMSGITSKDIKSLKKQFNKLHYAFDSSTIIDEYVFNSNKNLFCLVCKRSFSSPFEVVQNLECKGEYFHPRFIMNAKNEKFVCNHEGCKKRILRGEFPCCHKNTQSAGCLFGDGKHHLVLIDNNCGSSNNSF